MNERYISLEEFNIDRNAPDALERYLQAEELYRELLAEEPDEFTYKVQLISVLGIIAGLYKDIEIEMAFKYIGEAEKMLYEMREEVPGPRLLFSMAAVRWFTGECKEISNDASYITCYQEARTMLEEFVKQYPDELKAWLMLMGISRVINNITNGEIG